MISFKNKIVEHTPLRLRTSVTKQK